MIINTSWPLSTCDPRAINPPLFVLALDAMDAMRKGQRQKKTNVDMGNFD